MSAELIRKMRATRETWLDVNGHGYLLRRPPALWLSMWRNKGADEIDMLKHLVVGWRNVTEADLVPSGGSDPVPFDADLAVEWLMDRPEDILAITAAMNQAMDVRTQELEAQQKN